MAGWSTEVDWTSPDTIRGAPLSLTYNEICKAWNERCKAAPPQYNFNPLDDMVPEEIGGPVTILNLSRSQYWSQGVFRSFVKNPENPTWISVYGTARGDPEMWSIESLSEDIGLEYPNYAGVNVGGRQGGAPVTAEWVWWMYNALNRMTATRLLYSTPAGGGKFLSPASDLPNASAAMAAYWHMWGRGPTSWGSFTDMITYYRSCNVYDYYWSLFYETHTLQNGVPIGPVLTIVVNFGTAESVPDYINQYGYVTLFDGLGNGQSFFYVNYVVAGEKVTFTLQASQESDYNFAAGCDAMPAFYQQVPITPLIAALGGPRANRPHNEYYYGQGNLYLNYRFVVPSTSLGETFPSKIRTYGWAFGGTIWKGDEDIVFDPLPLGVDNKFAQYGANLLREASFAQGEDTEFQVLEVQDFFDMLDKAEDMLDEHGYDWGVTSPILSCRALGDQANQDGYSILFWNFTHSS